MVTEGVPLQAAGATVDLTPPTGLAMAGYLQREGAGATATHDPLEGNLLWLRDGNGGEVLWVALDAVLVDSELASRIAHDVAAAAGCHADAVLVCASHTHSSAAGWVHGLGGILADTADEAMREQLTGRLTEAARGLPGLFETCRLVFAEGQAPDAGGNRNDPAGPHDGSVGVLGLVDGSGRIIGMVLDYASHATVLGYDNLAWSADWPGAARRAVADVLVGLAPFESGDTSSEAARRPTVIFLQGAAGDASPRFVRRGQTFAEVDRLGGLVGAAALETLLTGEPAATGTVNVSHATATIPTRQLPSVEQVEQLSSAAEREWRAAEADHRPAPEQRVARTRYEGTLVLAALAEAGLPPSVEAHLSTVRIGDHAWVHLPVELFASFGLVIRRSSPFGWTRVIGYTDGYLGYVADTAAHNVGVYEAYGSMFDPRGGELLTDAALALLRQGADQRAGELQASGVASR